MNAGAAGDAESAGTAGTGPAGVVVGVGVASAATPDEVAGLVAAALAEVGRVTADVTAVATITTRRDHPAIVALGLPIVAFAAADLADLGGPGGNELTPDAGDGRPAVAEPAALRAAAALAVGGAGGGPADPTDAVLLVPKRRSARATVAVAAPRAGH